jgi:hypothetical protein
MNGKPMTTREELAKELTQAQIQECIAERKAVGATSCIVVTENGEQFLVSEWPPL